MRIGIFHPRLNTCGGGEWVAINVINSLRQNGHKVIVLTDELIDQNKFIRTFGQELQTDGEIVFPFHFFNRGAPYNVYTDMISCLILRSKCAFVIDTYTRLVLPGVDVVYMHYPLFHNLGLPPKTFAKLRQSIFLLPYRAYENKIRKEQKQVVFANSEFTSRAIERDLGLNSHLLYPPLSLFFLQNENKIFRFKRRDQVVTVSRFAPEKNLKIIPHIAKKLEKVRFIVVGNLNYESTYSALSESIKKLGVQKRVFLMANVPKTKLRKILLESKIYLHCAENEHFGISVIEAMASGCLPIVHDSGGPREFVPETLRYTSIDQATKRIENALQFWSQECVQNMHKKAMKFNQKEFSRRFLRVLSHRGLIKSPLNMYRTPLNERELSKEEKIKKWFS